MRKLRCGHQFDYTGAAAGHSRTGPRSATLQWATELAITKITQKRRGSRKSGDGRSMTTKEAPASVAPRTKTATKTSGTKKTATT